MSLLPESGPERERLLSALSHELRSPLAVISGYAELLHARSDEETRREAPVRIQAAAERLADVIDDLLVVLAVASGSFVLDLEQVDLGEAVEAAVSRFADSGTEIDLRWEGEGSWPLVEADREQLARILRNALLHAQMRARGGRVRVRGSGARGRAVVDVSDDGPPLPAETIARLFSRLSPVEVPGVPEVRSSGLELYKLGRLVELHGGSVSARSGVDGLTLSLSLPVAKSS